MRFSRPALEGPGLRELIAPWIEDARVDKVSRVLELTIRRVPQLVVSQGPRTGGQHDPHGVRARITFPVHEPDARGRYRTPTYKIAVAIEIEAGEGSFTKRVRTDLYAA